ncbi:MAG: HD domain-containing protein [Candidatus Paceibacterota bacterium]|jgi:putative hydrolase of HD superfamily
MTDTEKIKGIANFLYEVGMLSKTPRSWSSFLGSGSQSVAEHINRTVYIGYVLGSMRGGSVNCDKIIKMCLFHDLSEARISDLNYVHQKYTVKKEHEATQDLIKTLAFGNDLEKTIAEYETRETEESILAKEADNLEFLVSLKEQVDVGNERARTWIPSTVKRLKTEEAKKLADAILSTESDEWWFGDKEDKWWVDRNKESL